ncbi:MAG: hypothetical protein GY804_14990 [Alphaproteobacteria bacterium]|nr:hypothetical protein [Alphaproteobacteria bacterium]
MTAYEKTLAIANLMSSGLPTLLTAASLDNFDLYQNYSPEDDKKKIVSVYIDAEDDDTNIELFSVIIQCQLYGQDKIQEYHSVIMPFLRKNLKAIVVEMQIRDSIKSDLWPMDQNGSSFVYYSVSFLNSLDDCV